jgi:T-complex protein 1 subunit beta
MLANPAMDTDKIKIYGSRVRVDSMAKVAEIEEAERDKMRSKVGKITGHGINCFINRQLIYNFSEEIFASNGVMAIEHADFDGIERLAAVTGGEICSTFDHPELVKLGQCDLIEEIMIGKDRLIQFFGCASEAACTVVLRGASNHLLDEAERSLHDALCVLARTVTITQTIPGGGATEMAMSLAIEKAVPAVEGKASLAMEAFAKALRQLPTIIADNAGYNSSELVTQLRAAHANGKPNSGLDMYSGCVADMTELGVRESFKSKLQVLSSAAEAAEMILRVDDIIKCAPRQRE